MKREPVKRLSGWGSGIKGLDEGLRDLVVDLNHHGYRTWGSCEGGHGHDYKNCFISFQASNPVDPEDIEELRGIIRSHTDTPFIIVTRPGRKGTRELESIDFKGPLKEKNWTEQDMERWRSFGTVEPFEYSREEGYEEV